MAGTWLAVAENRHYAYPDALLGCDQPESQQVYSPLLTIEIFPLPAVAYDRNKKRK